MERPLEARDPRLGAARGIPCTTWRIGCPTIFPYLSRDLERGFIRLGPRVGKEYLCTTGL